MSPIFAALIASTFHVTLWVDKKTSSGLAPIEDGAKVESGEKFQLRVKIDQPAFVYAVQFFADGTSAVLYPKDHDVRVQAGVELRIPPEGYWFELDDSVGPEDIYLIASKKPIDDADAKTAGVLKKVKTTGTKPKTEKKTDPPKTIPKNAVAVAVAEAERTYAGGLTMRTRGIKIVADTPNNEIAIRSDDTGVAVLRFSFQHIAKARQ